MKRPTLLVLAALSALFFCLRRPARRWLRCFNGLGLKKRLLAIFVTAELLFILAAAVLTQRGVALVGDEPHYLAISQSLARDHDLNVFNQYFRGGFKEYVRLRKGDDSGDTMAVIQGAERSMRVALSREMDRLDTHLPFLATVGSTSPYVGLFGTVWGIMHSFHALGNVQQATLALVAPGISEALVATAIGLFAAIPAVIAYNRFSNQVERLNNRYEEFMQEFSTLLQRQGRG